jgi:tetratricopeptide (TPR) repeat protein
MFINIARRVARRIGLPSSWKTEAQAWQAQSEGWQAQCAAARAEFQQRQQQEDARLAAAQAQGAAWHAEWKAALAQSQAWQARAEQAERAAREAAAGTMQRLRELSGQGEWPQVEQGARQHLAETQGDEALALTAYALQQQGRLEEAARFAAVAASTGPGRWLSHFVAGVALKGLGRGDEACAHLRQALDIAPTDRQTLRQFFESLAMSRDVEHAAAEYQAHCERAGLRAEVVVAPIRSVDDWARSAGLPLLELGEPHAIPFVPPRVWGQPPVQEAGSALSNAPYVAELADVRIFGGSSLILAPDGTVLSDVGAHPRFASIVSFAYEPVVRAQEPGKLLLDLSDYETRDLEAGMMLSGLASNAFGHWLPEFLPRLQFLQQHPDYAGLPLIVDEGMPQAHFDHLARLSSNPLVRIKPTESLRCKRLLVAPAPAFLAVETLASDIPVSELPGLSPPAMQFLRGPLRPDGAVRRDRRIFLGRRKLQWRRLLNEQEIGEGLAAHGFETVYTEDMDVATQIALFQSAAWVVGPNGSALLNVVFADPSVKLLVLSQPDLYNWGTFQGPMESLGYQPLFVCGDSVAGVNSKHADYEVPPERILAALRHMGLDDGPAGSGSASRGSP